MTRAEELAWFAGIFEGEGCVFLRKFVRGKAKTLHLHGGFRIEMTDEDVIERVLLITGVGTVKERRNGSWGGLGKKVSWYWQVQNRKEFEIVANMLRPFLCKRRAEKLAEVESKLTWKERWWRAVTA